MKKIFFFCLFIISFQVMTSQNIEEKNDLDFVLEKKLLKTSFSNYETLFKPLQHVEALKMGVSSNYNYIYKYDDLIYHNEKVDTLVIQVRNNHIIRIHFEIDYSSKQILYNLIDKLGHPSSGKSNPTIERFENPNRDITDKSNILYENFRSLHWDSDENYFKVSISNIQPPQLFGHQNSKLWIEFYVVDKFYKYVKIQPKNLSQKDVILFESQKKVFESLGYFIEIELSTQLLISKMFGSLLDYPEAYSDTYPESWFITYFEEVPFTRLYYFLGWTIWNSKNSVLEPISSKCIWFDVSFLKYNDDYKEFMKWMGRITDGKINFSNFSIIDNENDQKVFSFEVNDEHKKWTINKKELFDSFIKRFSELASEFNIEGNYTFFHSNNDQFVIDFKSNQEKGEFEDKTGLELKWLSEIKSFDN